MQSSCISSGSKWMALKGHVRPDLDGTLPHLKVLLKQRFRRFTVDDARAHARHCRDTMRAYISLSEQGAEAQLDRLHIEEKKMTSHRRVLDSSDGLLKLQAQIPLTEQQATMANRTATARANKIDKEQYQSQRDKDFESRKRRIARLHMPADKRHAMNEASKVRLQKSKNNTGGKKTITLKAFIDSTLNKLVVIQRYL
jgi:hypothetical protein